MHPGKEKQPVSTNEFYDILTNSQFRRRTDVARRPIIAGNWKMNKGTAREATDLAAELVEVLKKAPDSEGLAEAVDVVICPPYTVYHAAREAIGDFEGVAIGAQDAFWKTSGAYTSQVS